MARKKLNTGKAPAHDGITPEMIKYLGGIGRQLLLELLHKIIRNNEIPPDHVITRKRR